VDPVKLAVPNDGDIYLEAVYELDAYGNFREPKEDTRGALIRKDQYTSGEVFAIPPQDEEKSNDEAE